MESTKAYLAESIPWGLDDLRGVSGVEYTEEVLLRLVSNAQRSIDLTAMYWCLLAEPGRFDHEDLTEEQLTAQGAEHGRQLYQALEDAAGRGVRIRVLQSPGFGDVQQEPLQLEARYPNQVQVRTADMRAWYGAGIMHQKCWIFDDASFYLGSANMDWRSLTQVKELGVVVENHPELAAELDQYFNRWWDFTGLELGVERVWDPAVEIERSVPNWSVLVPVERRTPSPLDRPEQVPVFNLAKPAALNLAELGGAFIAGSPPEICEPGRTHDLEAWLQTIRQAERSVCISVMSFRPIDRYPVEGEEESLLAVWWPVLHDGLLRAAITRGIQVRLLIAQWAYTSERTLEILRALQTLGRPAEPAEGQQVEGGRLEVRLFQVPGWDRTEGVEREYPGHSRVNHPKFMVTDQRLQVSTSNLSWSYHAVTAGCSFNTDQPILVRKAQELFDRDWASRYAFPLA